MDFEIKTVAIIVAVIAVIFFGFKKLITDENRKNDADAPVLRDSDTKLGDQGRKNHKG